MLSGLIARARRSLARMGRLVEGERGEVSLDGARREAERLGAGFPPLLVEAERVASSVAQGIHGRRRVGTGEAFWQYRRFSVGDSRAQVDWRRSARSDTLFVRENEWEAAQSLWLWRDGSTSMHFRSAPGLPMKRDRADVILLATAMLLVRAGEQVALFGADRVPRTGKAAVDRIIAHLFQADAAGMQLGLPPPAPLPRNGVVVWIADFLDPVEELADRIEEMAARGATGHLLMLLDPAEETLPYMGRAEFEGLEGEAPLLLGRVEGVRSAYHARLRAQKDGLRNVAQRIGWSFSVHHTDQPATQAVMALYAALAGSRAAPRGRSSELGEGASAEAESGGVQALPHEPASGGHA